MPVEINSRGEGGLVSYGGKLAQRPKLPIKAQVLTPGNLQSSIASPESGQQASVLCEL